jgi:hypothetical protein
MFCLVKVRLEFISYRKDVNVLKSFSGGEKELVLFSISNGLMNKIQFFILFQNLQSDKLANLVRSLTSRL